jgi:hypothetical protein
MTTPGKVKIDPEKSSIHEVAIDHSDEISGDYVRPRLVPLSWLEPQLGEVLWDRNAKLHDIGGLYESIQEYGFIDPPKWDSALNSGAGGIVFGNGRTKTLVQLLIEAKSQGQGPPRGIPRNTQTGEWYIPVGFGVDQPSQAKAEALGVDHNNSVLTGGDFDHLAMAGMWDREGYLELLTSIADQRTLPITVDEDALASLILMADRKLMGEEPIEEVGEGDGEPKVMTCPSCGHEFTGKS